jgi:hypothetical protein
LATNATNQAVWTSFYCSFGDFRAFFVQQSEKASNETEIAALRAEIKVWLCIGRIADRCAVEIAI